MPTVNLDTSSIHDWDSFHAECREAFGFPKFYGMNMDAWIDCLSYLDEGDGMSKFHLGAGELLTINVADSKSFETRLPEIFFALAECTNFVNRRYIDAGKQPLLNLVFH